MYGCQVLIRQQLLLAIQLQHNICHQLVESIQVWWDSGIYKNSLVFRPLLCWQYSLQLFSSLSYYISNCTAGKSRTCNHSAYETGILPLNYSGVNWSLLRESNSFFILTKDVCQPFLLNRHYKSEITKKRPLKVSDSVEFLFLRTATR